MMCMCIVCVCYYERWRGMFSQEFNKLTFIVIIINWKSYINYIVLFITEMWWYGGGWKKKYGRRWCFFFAEGIEVQTIFISKVKTIVSCPFSSKVKHIEKKKNKKFSPGKSEKRITSFVRTGNFLIEFQSQRNFHEYNIYVRIFCYTFSVINCMFCWMC